MSNFFGYVDNKNDMYVIASATNRLGHSFPVGVWTKIPVKVKYPIITNGYDSYNSVDGYIDFTNNLYLWRDKQEPVLVDTDVKQAYGSNKGYLYYVKRDNTLWRCNCSYTASTISKTQIASDAKYATASGSQYTYRTLGGTGCYNSKVIGKVKDIIALGSYSGIGHMYAYIDMYDNLYAEGNGKLKVASNVLSIKTGADLFLTYITKSGDLYCGQPSNMSLVASNVDKYWSNKTGAVGLNAIFYTTTDQPSILKVASESSTENFYATARTTPTPIKILGTDHNKPNAITTIFIKQPDSNSINLPGKSISLEWSISTDLEEDAITYEIEFYNGSTWVSIATKITGSTYDCILPICNTSNAQFRVRAFDNENDASPYTMSNVFTVAAQLALVRDGNNVKTYKNGIWKII
ncbi:hypothetical protein PDN53_22300 [Bacillus cereus]|uniref:hypothetical protein n=1 Tax=Bacillus thuringiensis TaxID=1428 RepID=UPI0028536446|nr:hypothetical protein [Bacillus thuringiensis]MCU5508174.1 hypothetical protein [Bacillus cereus]MDA2416989.1 hypothetical protein [Bacillus cereus]MDR4924588.1 hypothetical protein [Bacillus thuringiensis]MED3584434.1 hypothetical protein [Bacillus thuringiensis]HDR4861025.1 hypothetical protein [Bacillus cereus]